jgi:hypothetical protein
MGPKLLAEINYLSVIAAAVGAWLFGALYYGVLGKAWVAAQGKTMEAFKREQAPKMGTLAGTLPFILSFVANILIGVVLFGILTHMGMWTVRAGMISAAFCWFGFILTTLAVNNAYSGRSFKLTAIDAGHWLGALLIIGAVVGYFGPTGR